MINWPKASFVFQTDYEGQAKKLLELMENTDVIIVAGGDGTLQEVWPFSCVKPFGEGDRKLILEKWHTVVII